jgi:hypothetical protein
VCPLKVTCWDVAPYNLLESDCVPEVFVVVHVNGVRLCP